MITKIIRIGAKLLFKCFPLKKRILMLSYEGTKQADSPMQIYKYIKNMYPEIEIVWLLNKTIDGIISVKYDSLKALFYRATSKVILDNMFCNNNTYVNSKKDIKKEKFRTWINRKRGQKYVTTWHGTPLKKMYRDQIGSTVSDCFFNKPMYLIMGNTYTADILNHILFDKAEVKLFGSPRNDILVNANENLESQIKKTLKLPQDKKIILYAPTFRSNSDISQKHIKDSGIHQINLIDFEKLFNVLTEKFGGNWVFICRFHYLVESIVDWENLERKYPNQLINGNLHDDIADYLLCSDVLITDYSSCMFDYAILNRPVFLFCHDLEHYQNEERGFYIDIRQLPFQLAQDFDELLNNIKNFDYEAYCHKLGLMKQHMGYCEEGNATEKAGEFIYSLLKNDD